jgi:hypothetical protein
MREDRGQRTEDRRRKLSKNNVAECKVYCYNFAFFGLAMDRRDFLKRSIATLPLAGLALNIDDCGAFWQIVSGTAGPIDAVKGLPNDGLGPILTNRMIYGGNLFNAYARGRDSVDVAEARVKRTCQFLWKGAY